MSNYVTAYSVRPLVRHIPIAKTPSKPPKHETRRQFIVRIMKDGRWRTAGDIARKTGLREESLKGDLMQLVTSRVFEAERPYDERIYRYYPRAAQ